MRDGRLVEHQHLFPTLGKSLPCVGSHGLAPDDAALLGSWHVGSDVGLEADPSPVASRQQASVSR